MASRKYNTHKFRYSTDDGRTIIRIQREYLKTDGSSITPITQTFLSREVNFQEKVEPFHKRPRFAEVTVINPDNTDGVSKVDCFLPYSPNINEIANLRNHLREFRDFAIVVCVEYRGEDYEREKPI